MNSSKPKDTASEKSGDCEHFPFPAVLVDPMFEILERNRLAQKLLLPPWRLRRYLKKFEKGEKKDRFFVSNLEDRCYFVAFLCHPRGYLIAFLENLLYLYQPLTRAILSEGVELMGQWQAHEALLLQGFGEEKDRALAERIAARTCRIREQMAMVHRLLSLTGRTLSKPLSCNASGLIRLLQSKLKEHRITLDFDGEKGVNCFVSPEALVAVVVNLVQFVLVYEGESRLNLALKPRKDQWVLRLSFREREGLFSDFAALFEMVKNGTELPRAIGLAPLFSSMILCRENGLELELFSDGEVGRIDLVLPDGKEQEVQFLGSKLAKEEKVVEAWIAQILFPNL